MKKRIILLLIGFFLFVFPTTSQNLVPNPSFEVNTSCPGTWGDIGFAAPWTTPSMGSPDYFHSCSSNPEFTVPVNILGFSPAHTGNGYAGICVYTDTISFAGTPMRVEYLQVQLSSALVAGQCYNVKFWVSCCEGNPALIGGDPNIFGLSSNIAAYISATPPVFPAWHGVLPIVGTPQISSPATMNDTATWKLVSGIYTATGGEQFITIGNWDMSVYGNGPPNSTGPFEPSCAYYFIDDVEISPLQPLNLGNDLLICEGDAVTLNANTGASSYLWNTGATTVSVTVNAAGTYWVEQMTGSCYQSDTMVLTTEDCTVPPTPTPIVVPSECTFYIPNSFTPNDDGKNDLFGAVGLEVLDFEMMIFNRWGELLFKTNTISEHWNGLYNNNMAKQDVYVYKLSYMCNTERKYTMGHIALIR